MDPNFGEEFNLATHGPELDQISLSHLTISQQSTLKSLLQKDWRIFSKKGVTVPVKDYQCEIDTGNARPVACKNPTFGPLELPIIKKAIEKLLELGHIRQIFDGAWLSKPLLAPKPHQENVTDISNFVWRFCVNYVGLNSVTKVFICLSLAATKLLETRLENPSGSGFSTPSLGTIRFTLPSLPESS